MRLQHGKFETNISLPRHVQADASSVEKPSARPMNPTMHSGQAADQSDCLTAALPLTRRCQIDFVPSESTPYNTVGEVLAKDAEHRKALVAAFAESSNCSFRMNMMQIRMLGQELSTMIGAGDHARAVQTYINLRAAGDAGRVEITGPYGYGIDEIHRVLREMLTAAQAKGLDPASIDLPLMSILLM